MNEICQLDRADIIRDENITCFSINENVLTGDDAAFDGEQAPVKSVKNEASIRLVPVHPDLIACGFDEYLSWTSHNKHKRLFPSLELAATGYYSDVFTKHFARFMDKLGLTDRALVFHSFRHNFRDSCRDAGIDEAHSFALGGWADGKVGNKYGAGFKQHILLSELRKVRYPTVHLPRLSIDLNMSVVDAKIQKNRGRPKMKR